jgi:hypothetical protein
VRTLLACDTRGDLLNEARDAAAAASVDIASIPDSEPCERRDRLGRDAAAAQAEVALASGDVAGAEAMLKSAAPSIDEPVTQEGLLRVFSDAAMRGLSTGELSSADDWSPDGYQSDPLRLTASRVLSRSGRHDEAIAVSMEEFTNRLSRLGMLSPQTGLARVAVCDAFLAADRQGALRGFIEEQLTQLERSPNRASPDSMAALLCLARPYRACAGDDASIAMLARVLDQRISEDELPRWHAVKFGLDAIRFALQHDQRREAEAMRASIVKWLHAAGLGEGPWAAQARASIGSTAVLDER